MLCFNRTLTVLLFIVLLAGMLALAPRAVSEEPEGISGHYVYVADGKEGLCIIDVSDPTMPTVAGTYHTPDVAYDVAISGNYVYLADRGAVRIIDVSDPAVPVETGFYEASGDMTGSLRAMGNYVYLADGKKSLHIIDVSNPAEPAEVGFYETVSKPLDVAVAGNYAYVCAGLEGLEILNLSDPASPVKIAFYNATLEKPEEVSIAGDHAYVVDSANGLRIINVSDPATLVEEGTSIDMIYPGGVALGTDIAYVRAENPSIHILDVADISAPVEISTFDTRGSAEEIAYAENYIYMADGQEGLRVIDVSNPSTPVEVGFYDTPGYAMSVAVAQEPEAPQITIQVRPADGAVMVYVPAGEFIMGSPKGEWSYEEEPQHTVYLGAYWIDQTEVTNAQFEAFVDATGYTTGAEQQGEGTVFVDRNMSEVRAGADWRHPEGPDSSITERMDNPVMQVNWNDALSYCEWAGGRLPTEAEWEKAARGTDGRCYPWGDEKLSCQFAVIKQPGLGFACGQGQHAAPVGSKPAGASPYGALDMSGNVSEWVNDWFDSRYYQTSPPRNPPGPEAGTEKGFRDDSWITSQSADHFRCARRDKAAPDARDNITGFRCAVPESDTGTPAAEAIDSVLFIGGLETSSLDVYFPLLADSGDDPIIIGSERFTNEPSSLRDQWKRGSIGPKPGILAKEIRESDWDVVVLQQDMTFYIDKADEFCEYAKKFNEEIKAAGGEAVLYMTWRIRIDTSIPVEDIAAIYSKAGADLGVKVAPVALAFERSLQERPDLEVFNKCAGDTYGLANEHGYYLTMCVLYATIFDRSPVGLSYRMMPGGWLQGSEGSFFWEEEISDEDAAFLQQVAWDTVQEYQKK